MFKEFQETFQMKVRRLLKPVLQLFITSLQYSGFWWKIILLQRFCQFIANQYSLIKVEILGQPR